MALTKTRKIGKIINANRRYSALDSDNIITVFNAGGSSGGTIDIVSTVDDLPLSADIGTKKLVTGNSTIYLYNNGWYKIALVNNFDPVWVNEPSGAYSLDIGGSATTITVLASDEDDVPLSYSAITDSSFDTFATVTHDSDKHNVFTITPTGTSGYNTGTITFKASDGVNIVQALSSFTLAFSNSQSRFTTMLLKTDSDGTDNQIDTSSSARTISEYGGVNSTAFTPYHPGGYSAFWSGTETNAVSAFMYPTNSDDNIMTFGTGDFTIEFWLYFKNSGSIATILDGRPASTTGAYIVMGKLANNTLTLNVNGSDVITTSAQEINTWYHIAVVRNSGTITYYIDGTSAGSAVDSTNLNSTPTNRPIIGANGYTTGWYSLNGYMRDFRIVKGTAVYTSNFTRPTSDLPTISGTTLHTFNKPYIEDLTSNQYPIQNSGTCGTERVSPFDYVGYDIALNGGSVYFDGNGDQLQAANSADLDPSSGDMTWEFWMYPTTGNSNSTVACRWHVTQGRSWLIYSYASGNIGITFFVGGTQYGVGYTQNLRYRWNHVAIVKNATDNTTKVWLNGRLKNTTSYGSSSWRDSTGPMSIGFNLDNAPTNWYYGGFIQDFNITQRALYTDSEIPVPTSPVTLDSDCKISTGSNRHWLYDIAKGTEVSTSGVIITNAGAKWTQEAAIYMDAANDYIEVPYNDLSIGTEDFTCEAWINPTEGTGGHFVHAAGWNEGNNQGYWMYVVNSTKSMRLYASNGSWNNMPLVAQSSSNVWTAGTWQHVAFCRDNGVLKLFVNGTEDSDFTTTYTASLALVGLGGSKAGQGAEPRGIIGVRIADGGLYDGYVGYIQDFRLTKGVSRYSANFTPPTGPLLG